MKWQIKTKPPVNFLLKFKNYPPLLLTLLWHRGITSKKEINEFLFPKFNNFKKNNPFLLADFVRLVDIVKKAKSDNQKVCIFGDYDFDGIASAIILKAYLDKIGLSSVVYIPDRDKEGYGLNIESIRFFKSIGIKLLITVDCGISNNKEILYAKHLKLKTIIIDHHLVNEMPKADVVIDPYRKDDKYPFKKLSCAGLVLKVCMGLAKTSDFKNLIPKNYYCQFLDLAAIATIADYMDLVNENRELVLLGFKQIALNTRKSIETLFKKARLDKPFIRYLKKPSRFFIENLNSEIVKFYIAPRINVASRIDHSSISYKFLTSTSLKELNKYADIIENLLQKRQSLEKQFLNEALGYIAKHKLDQKPIIIIPINRLPVGLLGIIASKIVDIYQKPIFLISVNHFMCRGSARGPENFSIIDLLKKSKKFLSKFGGHRRACGFEVTKTELKKFIEHIDSMARNSLKLKKAKTVLKIDYVLTPEEINENLLNILKYLEPTGDGNPPPLFLIKNALILKKTKLKKYTRILIQITDTKKKIKYLEAIMTTNTNKFASVLSKNKIYNLVVKIKEQTHQGLKNILLDIVDFKCIS